MRLVNWRGLDRTPSISPTVEGEPAKVQRTGPAKAFVDNAVVQHERSAAEPDRYAPKCQSECDAKHG
jgi:hypothetical protein